MEITNDSLHHGSNETNYSWKLSCSASFKRKLALQFPFKRFNSLHHGRDGTVWWNLAYSASFERYFVLHFPFKRLDSLDHGRDGTFSGVWDVLLLLNQSCLAVILQAALHGWNVVLFPRMTVNIHRAAKRGVGLGIRLLPFCLQEMGKERRSLSRGRSPGPFLVRSVRFRRSGEPRRRPLDFSRRSDDWATVSDIFACAAGE